MKIVEALRRGGEGAVLADEFMGIVRLWTLSGPFKDGRTMRALRRFFPYVESKGEFLRLGGFSTLSVAQHWIAEAKMTSYSLAVQGLFRYDVPENLKSIKHYS